MTDLSLEAQEAKAALQQALPEREWQAVSSWLETFYPYQQEWILDLGRFSLLNKARQIGASHALGGGCSVLWGLLGETTTVVSLGEREAQEVLDKAYKHSRVLTELGSQWAAPKWRHGELHLASGGRAIALPTSSGGRSYSGNVILDEIAYYKKPEAVWDGAAAAVMHESTGGKIRCMTTPNGVGNFWYALWTDPKKSEGYRKHQVTLAEARAQGLKVKEENCWKQALGDPRIYGQLFECKFIDDQFQYIPTGALVDCCVDGWYRGAGDAYFGLDVGKSVDLTVLYIVKQDMSGVRWTCTYEVKKRTSYEDLESLIDWAINSWGCRRGCIDSTGIGSFPAEQLQKKYGTHRIEAVAFTPQSKEDLATGMYSAFTNKTVRIPRDSDLFNDLCSLKRIVTSSGNVRYDAPHTAEGHADRAWALALALHACSKPLNYRTEVTGA